MKTNPCAKINLGLYVTERRSDGYHNIETVFYPIPLTDTLKITEDDEDALCITGIPVDGRKIDNLVVRAVEQIREDYHTPPLFITLEKNIPSGAGLGGGSSDAASTMLMLNEMLGLDMSEEEMEHRVSRLGADCAFFIKKRPTLATGIGNIFSPIDIDLTGYYIALVKPDEFVSTREAYSMIKPKMPKFPLREAIARPVEEWKDLLYNDFEDSVFPAHPIIGEIKQRLYQLGATYACMSGSGSSVFGLFKDDPSQLRDIFHPHFFFSAKL